MYKTIETKRLILKLLDKKSTDLVLEFLKENREDFSKYEADKQEMYFTKFYQEYIIQSEYDAAMKKGYLRYYIFEKSDQRHIIGTVSVGQLRAYPYCSGIIGYKMAVHKKNMGYGTEAVKAACQAAFSWLGVHRLEAYVMEKNIPSIRILEKCGFEKEGKCIKNLKVNGAWQDHLLYAKIKE